MSYSNERTVNLGGSKMESENIVPAIDYSQSVTPPTYICHECHAFGVRLLRKESIWNLPVRLLCARCVARRTDPMETDDYVMAVPTSYENPTFWCSHKIPPAGKAWWENLPMEPSVSRPAA